MRTPRILVVDDHLDTLQLFESYLGLAGFTVTVAASGRQALELAPDGFDAVVTDLAMPGMDGPELIKGLRVLQGPHPVPIVVVSGQILVGPSPLAGVSYCGLMKKPCDLTTLASTVRLLIDACPHNCRGCPHLRGRIPTPVAHPSRC